MVGELLVERRVQAVEDVHDLERRAHGDDVGEAFDLGEHYRHRFEILRLDVRVALEFVGDRLGHHLVQEALGDLHLLVEGVGLGDECLRVPLDVAGERSHEQDNHWTHDPDDDQNDDADDELSVKNDRNLFIYLFVCLFVCLFY